MWSHVLKLPQELLISTQSSELSARSVTPLMLLCSKEAKSHGEAEYKRYSEQSKLGPFLGHRRMLSEETTVRVHPLAPVTPAFTRSIYTPSPQFESLHLRLQTS